MPSSFSSSSTSTTTTHQAKRPYTGSHYQANTQRQSTITSYFPSFQTSLFPSAIRSDTTTHTSSPTLPPLVQSNLLSVGMRVRKSVPEGYKTELPRKHSSYGGAGGGGGGGAGWGLSPGASAGPPAPFKTPASARRELTPFCGIMRVGGMAVQGWNHGPGEEDGGDVESDVPGEDDVPFWSSQGSTISTISMDSRTGYKRRFDEEEDEEPEGAPYDIWRDGDDDVQLSPKSRPVDLAPRFGLGVGRRAMAVPKSRRKAGSGTGGVVKSTVMEGQENDNLGVLEVDFGEAEFMDWSACLG